MRRSKEGGHDGSFGVHVDGETRAPVRMSDQQRASIRARTDAIWRQLVESYGIDLDEVHAARLAKLLPEPGQRPSSTPLQHYRRWTPGEVEQLIGFVAAGRSVPDIAAALSRTEDSIKSKAFLLRLPIPATRARD